MRVYLCRWTGTGTDADPIRPHGSELVGGHWVAADLRGSGVEHQTSNAGWCLLFMAGDNDIGEVAGQRIFLGSEWRAANLTARARLNLRLGISLTRLTLRGLVRELLVTFGDDANPARWNRPRADLLGRRLIRFRVGALDLEADDDDDTALP